MACRYSKRRRLDDGNVENTFISPLMDQQSSQRQRKIPNIKPQTAPEMLPNQILYAQTPQDLSYAILTTDKVLYTKQELLTIIAKLDHMYKPQFPEPCDYIN